MAKVIPFRSRRHRHEAAAYWLALSGRYERLSVSKPWLHPRQPERLGNLLQRLAFARPSVVFVIENLVAEIVAELDREDHDENMPAL